MSHFSTKPSAEEIRAKEISDFAAAQVSAAVKSLQRRYFELPLIYHIRFNDPTIPDEEAVRLADEWAEEEFKKELQA